MESKWGIRYLVLAAGGPEDKCTEEDVESFELIVKKALSAQLGPMAPTVTKLTAQESDAVTVVLLREKGLL